MCNYKDSKKHLELELIALKVNLYSMTIVNQKQEVKVLMQAKTNDRKLRKRDETSLKSQTLHLKTTTIRDNTFAE